jgi:uncharacterized membrane protein YraQ (UPF0718 family)
MEHFAQVLLGYLWEVIPALVAGFLISGLMFELVPERAKAVLRCAFVTLPKEIGVEIAIGLLLAATVETFMPVQRLIQN